MSRFLVVAGVIGVVLGGATVSGCSGAASGEDRATVTQTVMVTVASDAEPQQAAKSAQSGEGTRANPFPAGTSVGNEEWTIVLAPTVINANDLVAAENQFNDPPIAGRQFVMTQVTATYTGSETGTAWLDLQIEFVGAAGNTFGSGSDDYCGSIPANLNDVGELYEGGVATGNVCVSVPSDQIEGGVWAVSTLWGDPVFVATT